ncbi:MAG: hypothetical protein GY724_14680, partial [Actinomycetia bacterium]|nr:hypothetical protein [Actinomycetes bacterium]
MKRIIVLAFAVITAAIALPAPASAQSVPTPADCERQGAKIYYQFLYNDGLMDIGCADKNEVAGAVAPELHVSCSDKFNLGDKPKGTPGSGEKSNLGTTADGSERLVVDYLIMKDLNKDKPKTCGSA